MKHSCFCKPNNWKTVCWALKALLCLCLTVSPAWSEDHQAMVNNAQSETQALRDSAMKIAQIVITVDIIPDNQSSRFQQQEARLRELEGLVDDFNAKLQTLQETSFQVDARVVDLKGTIEKVEDFHSDSGLTQTGIAMQSYQQTLLGVADGLDMAVGDAQTVANLAQELIDLKSKISSLYGSIDKSFATMGGNLNDNWAGLNNIGALKNSAESVEEKLQSVAGEIRADANQGIADDKELLQTVGGTVSGGSPSVGTAGSVPGFSDGFPMADAIFPGLPAGVGPTLDSSLLNQLVKEIQDLILKTNELERAVKDAIASDTKETDPARTIRGKIAPPGLEATWTFQKNSDPSNGSVVVNPDGSYIYTPNAGFWGTDTFSVIAKNGEDMVTTTVVVTVPDPDSKTDTASSTIDDAANIARDPENKSILPVDSDKVKEIQDVPPANRPEANVTPGLDGFQGTL